MAGIFQLNDNKCETAQDIDLKFSAFIYHISEINWQKKFLQCSISRSVTPSSMQKLWIPLATIFVEKKIEKRFGVILDPFDLLHERNFWYLEKNGVLKLFIWVQNLEPSDPYTYYLLGTLTRSMATASYSAAALNPLYPKGRWNFTSP